jgi:hypothetical protein
MEENKMLIPYPYPTIALLSNLPFLLNTTHDPPSQPIVLTVTYATITNDYKHLCATSATDHQRQRFKFHYNRPLQK